MMNLRGLILGDLEHTAHLQTLQFAVRTHSGSDIKEQIWDWYGYELGSWRILGSRNQWIFYLLIMYETLISELLVC